MHTHSPIDPIRWLTDDEIEAAVRQVAAFPGGTLFTAEPFQHDDADGTGRYRYTLIRQNKGRPLGWCFLLGKGPLGFGVDHIQEEEMVDPEVWAPVPTIEAAGCSIGAFIRDLVENSDPVADPACSGSGKPDGFVSDRFQDTPAIADHDRARSLITT